MCWYEMTIRSRHSGHRSSVGIRLFSGLDGTWSVRVNENGYWQTVSRLQRLKMHGHPRLTVIGGQDNEYCDVGGTEVAATRPPTSPVRWMLSASARYHDARTHRWSDVLRDPPPVKISGPLGSAVVYSEHLAEKMSRRQCWQPTAEDDQKHQPVRLSMMAVNCRYFVTSRIARRTKGSSGTMYTYAAGCNTVEYMLYNFTWLCNRVHLYY